MKTWYFPHLEWKKCYDGKWMSGWFSRLVFQRGDNDAYSVDRVHVPLNSPLLFWNRNHDVDELLLGDEKFYDSIGDAFRDMNAIALLDRQLLFQFANDGCQSDERDMLITDWNDRVAINELSKTVKWALETVNQDYGSIGDILYPEVGARIAMCETGKPAIAKLRRTYSPSLTKGGYCVVEGVTDGIIPSFAKVRVRDGLETIPTSGVSFTGA